MGSIARYRTCSLSETPLVHGLIKVTPRRLSRRKRVERFSTRTPLHESLLPQSCRSSDLRREDTPPGYVVARFTRRQRPRQRKSRLTSSLCDDSLVHHLVPGIGDRSWPRLRVLLLSWLKTDRQVRFHYRLIYFQMFKIKVKFPNQFRIERDLLQSTIHARYILMWRIETIWNEFIRVVEWLIYGLFLFVIQRFISYRNLTTMFHSAAKMFVRDLNHHKF